MNPEKCAAGIHWFRKGLRLHDNPSLIHALNHARKVYPVFCIDPHFAKPEYVGVNRYNFLLECLHDLDIQLRERGSRLFVLRGKPEIVIPETAMRWGAQLVTFESDTEPYAKRRDKTVCEQLRSQGVKIFSSSSHLLTDPEEYIAASGGSVPSTYVSFQKLFNTLGRIRQDFPSPGKDMFEQLEPELLDANEHSVPTLQEMGYSDEVTTPFKGGETEALQRLERYVEKRVAWVRTFSKPDTAPNSLAPSTTVTI